MPVIKIIDKLEIKQRDALGECRIRKQTGLAFIVANPDIDVFRISAAATDGDEHILDTLAKVRRVVACINACAGLTTEQLEIILDDNHTVTSLLTRSQNKLESLQHTLAAIAKEIELAGFQVGGPAADPDTDLNPRTARTLITRATERFAAIGALLAAHKD